MSSPTQQELDTMFGLDAESWSAMRSGQLPPKVARMLGGAGCLPLLTVLGGGITGALVGFATRTLVERPLEMSGPAWIFLCTVIGAMAFRLFLQNRIEEKVQRTRRQLQQNIVRNEVLRVKLERGPNGQQVLKAEDGRTFRVLPLGGAVPLDGEFRIYYVDLSSISPGMSGGATYFTLGVERV